MKLNSEQANQIAGLLTLNQEISRRMPLWNQGMGGNVSVKLSDELMAIKPSGMRLDELHSPMDFAYLNYQDFTSFLVRLTASSGGLSEKEYAYSQEIDKAKLKGFGEHRASMEAGFHAALKATYVLHFHHVNIVVFADLLAEAEGSEFLARWSDFFKVVPYRRPGWDLSAYFIKNQVPCPLILMQNHGAILQVDEPGELSKFLDFESELEIWLERRLGTTWKTGQKILNGSISSLAAPFKYFYPDVAIFESKLKKFLVEKDGLFSLDKNAKSKAVPKDLLENWQAMLYLHCLRPQMPGLAIEDAESLRGMPSEMARVKQMIALAAAQAMPGKSNPLNPWSRGKK